MRYFASCFDAENQEIHRDSRVFDLLRHRTMVFHLEPDAMSAFARIPTVEGDAEIENLFDSG